MKAKAASLASALSNIRDAEQVLDDLVASACGTTEMQALSSVYDQLTMVVRSLVQAQTTSDDGIFAQITASLKNQAGALQKTQESLQKIVTNTKALAKIVGYIGQATALIAAL